jgi:PadR family transcriptional regulator PadR
MMMALGKTNLEKMRLEKTSRDLPGHGVPGLDLPQGTLDLLILRTLLPGAQHGWAISERVQQVSENALRIQQGSLYPALHRLERRGWVKAKWGVSENNRKAKYYELTRSGRKQLDEETESWRKLISAVALVLESE